MEGEQRKKTELMVGLFLLIGIALLSGLILKFGRLREAFQDTYQIRVQFDDGSGLARGGPVTLGGTKIGIIESDPTLNSTSTGVDAILEIRDEVRIPAGSTFKIGGDGLMGDKLIVIKPPKQVTGEMIAKGVDQIIDGSGASGIGALEAVAEDISNQAGEVLEDVQIAVEKLTGAIENLDAGFLSKENGENFKSTLAKFDSAMGKLDDSVLGDRNLANVETTIGDLKEMAGSLKLAGADFAAASTSLKPAAEKVGPILDQIASVGDAAEGGVAALGGAARSVQSFLAQLEDGDGVLPALLEDGGLRTDFRNLIANLREHGILRYRDDNRVGEDGTTTEPEKPASRPASERSRFPWGRKP